MSVLCVPLTTTCAQADHMRDQEELMKRVAEAGSKGRDAKVCEEFFSKKDIFLANLSRIHLCVHVRVCMRDFRSKLRMHGMPNLGHYTIMIVYWRENLAQKYSNSLCQLRASSLCIAVCYSVRISLLDWSKIENLQSCTAW
jgi:hypothetical protein